MIYFLDVFDVFDLFGIFDALGEFGVLDVTYGKEATGPKLRDSP